MRPRSRAAHALREVRGDPAAVICPNCGATLGLATSLTLLAPPPPPPPPPPPAGRLVSVTSTAQLLAAVAAALPGDRIEMASGAYALTSRLTISRSGTQAAPIVLVGPRTAVLDGGGTGSYNYLNPVANWWVFDGFRVTSSIFGIEVGTYGSPGMGASDCIFRSIDIGQLGNGGVILRGNSSRNIVRANLIHDTGLLQYWYGEGVYIGSGASSNEPANDNQILDNLFGPNVRADHVDVKAGTRGNIIDGNISDATGWQYTDGSGSGGQRTDSVYSNQGLNSTFRGNVLNNLNSPSGTGFFNWQGSGTQYHANKCQGSAFSMGFATVGGSGNVIGCDNSVPAGMPFSNVPCTP
jgi:hypothetical protein